MNPISKLQKITESVLLNAKDREELAEMAISHPQINKLLSIHDALVDIALKYPIEAKMKHIQYMKESLEQAIDYMNSGDSTAFDKDDEFSDADVDPESQQKGSSLKDKGIPKYMQKGGLKIVVMTDKFNGLPERMRDFSKGLGDSSEELLNMIAAHRSVLEGRQIKAEEVGDDFNFTTMMAKKKKGIIEKHGG